MSKNVLFIICLLVTGCSSSNHYQKQIIEPVLMKKNVSEFQSERDNIFSLLVYSLVYDDWQSEDVPRRERRGYNIGALIVNDSYQPVYYDLNCINKTDNATQHGEVRAITNYLEEANKYNLKGHTIYTTLEPCVMCAGMMTMTSVDRIVYGMNDVDYSKAFERLAIDTRPIGGFAPYPRKVEAQASNAVFRKELDDAYQQFLSIEEEKILVKFLVSAKAKEIFSSAKEAFITFEVQHQENKSIYKSALNYYNEKEEE